jgi:ATP-dependent RNA helicase DDX31/DBP7
MAEDGILINFELGDSPLAQQAKFKGGRWRDRAKAKRQAKGGGTGREQLAKASEEQPGAAEQSTGTADSSRPVKRQKVEAKLVQSWQNGHQDAVSSARRIPSGANSQSRGRQVTSRLFTSNPAPVTNLEAMEKEEAGPVQPSNAPLSAEAESFLALGLSTRLAQHLSTKLELKAPTAIQKSTIPQLTSRDNDAFLQAETGSGKTLAYLLPIVQRIMALSHKANGETSGVRIHRDSGLFAIILAPTRELCKQIAVVLEKLLKCAPWLVSTSVIGGESKKSEKARLRKGVNILIATPGRLTDHLDHTEVLSVATVRWLVLDEGDRLMEMGFEEDIKTIVGRIRNKALNHTNKDGVALDKALPTRRVTVLCSATMKMNVQKLGEISLHEAVHITASKSGPNGTPNADAKDDVFSAPSQLKQSYIIAPAKLRLVTLLALLRSVFARRGSVMKAIVFISCADSVDFHFELFKDPEKTQEAAGRTGKDAIPSLAASTTAAAAYITSPANPTITLYRLHGSLQQQVRTSTLASFSSSKDPAVLITTDISSRGLDVPEVDLVVEYDPAFAVADHLHRVGRTARAGRPGRAVLFLQPGSEEGYISLLKTSSNPTPQSYDVTLQKGLSSAVNIPKGDSTTAVDEHEDRQAEKQSYNARAEALQLHLEQRLLAKANKSDGDAAVNNEDTIKRSKPQSRPREPENPLLVSARSAFRSHIRAYATHTREERGFFDMTQLHLGHMAKSFGLREAPGGIGGGSVRRAYKAPSTSSAEKTTKNSGGVGGIARTRDDPDEVDMDEFALADAAKRMREKMKQNMNAGASEFNIG